MRWVSPLLRVGTPVEAHQLGDIYTEDPQHAKLSIRSFGVPVMVPTVEMAAEVLSLLGYDQEWIDHVLSDWKD